ncbi:hypothetical protein M1L60_18075 [Actinoplanes sp. TRM 88003]|uniref:Uncharacterized protein n=1 Tax=Paractinoplanes aksuensis TaxID=2939490 RepID=A0ABT1DNY8_9ACTN|nr:hypothetical protein [Actinoplanes aksuensis]MCO8272505.1 hypothetical protein [Actinoplanes aksuensis]
MDNLGATNREVGQDEAAAFVPLLELDDEVVEELDDDVDEDVDEDDVDGVDDDEDESLDDVDDVSDFLAVSLVPDFSALTLPERESLR